MWRALVRPEHPGARRALEHAAREQAGLVVLLASMYGAVNRALERVTDEDEERQVVALLEHVGS